MKIHEYQGKDLLKSFGVPVPEGAIATTPDKVYEIAAKLGGTVVVKAQIHAGGRGKGGGVKVVSNAEEAKKAAEDIIGMNLITHQTGPEGQKVKTVLVEAGSAIDKEFYLGIVLDRANSRNTIMASQEGGMDIEEVAANRPEKILKVAVDPIKGFEEKDGAYLGKQLGLTDDQINEFIPFVKNLYDAYIKSDGSLAEINPLVLTKEGSIIALDAKINFDDNALFRHPEFEALRDLDEEDPAEIEAKKYDLSYVSLDGSIGCMVNGAGLAMATMDIIKHYGQEPANFLDVGGGATEENVIAAFKIILKDPKVKAILINIFGGIVKCDMIAEGIIAAAKDVGVSVPLVVRLQGTNVERGREILEKSDLNIVSADTLADAAEKVTGSMK